MRLVALAFVIAAASASAAAAAPTCSNAAGDPVRCDAPAAMPVGWKPSAEVMRARQEAQPPAPSLGELAGVAYLVGGLLTLIVLLPDFEDGKGGGWDPHRDDEG